MLATLNPRKPAWTVARGGVRLRLCGRPNAFGNALGDSIVGQMRSAGTQEDRLGGFIEQNQDRWDQRQGNYDQLVGAFGNAGPGNMSNGVRLTGLDGAQPGVMSDAGGGGRFDNVRGGVNFSGDTLPSMYPDPQVIGGGIIDGLAYEDWDSGVRTMAVRQASVKSVSLAPLGASVMGPSLPEIELQQRYTGGVTQAVSMGWKEAFNTDNSIGQRLIYGGLALAGTPDMMVESMLYAPLNIGPAARETGQYVARAGLQTDSAERNMDILRAVGTGAEAFSATGAWLVAPRPQAAGMSAQELTAVRATSESTSSSSFVVAPTRDAVRELKTFGMDVAERRAFFEGKQVIFEDPATAHPTVNIFQLSNDTLHAGIWDLVSDGSGAVASFSNRSRSLGNTLGVTNLELFGADLQNARLSDVLTRRGFTEGAPVFIDKYGFSKHVPTLRRMESLKNE